MNNSELTNELIKLLDKHRITNHGTFKRSAREAIAILERHTKPKRKRCKLLTRSEVLDSLRKNRRWKWFPATPW